MNQEPPQKLGFFRAGWRELGRKRERSRLRKQLQEQERERQQVLNRLGQRAWEEKIGLAEFASMHEQLNALASRAGELAGATQKAESEKAALEARRRAEAQRFDGLRRGVEEKKQPVEEALREARQRQGEKDLALKRGEARLASLAVEIGALEQQITSFSSSAAAEQHGQLAAAQARQQQLVAERTRLAGETAQAHTALADLSATVARLAEESQRHAAEIEKSEAQRKAALGEIDGELGRVQTQMRAAAQETGSVAQRRYAQFAALGSALYAQNTTEPSLADDVRRIATIDRLRAATEKTIEASLAETQLMPGGTMVKFAAVLLLVPVLLAGAAVGGYLGWSWWSERQAEEKEAVRVKVNPYLTHPLADRTAYVLANQLAEAKSEEEVAKLLLEAFRAIHLGIYTPAGKKILAGAERSHKDFFLYDFQWKTLAHGFAAHTAGNWENFSQLLGQNLLHLQDSTIFQTVFAQAVQARYEKARGAPNDPKSFLILLVDGLARRQLKPYTLSELANRQPKDLYVDPVQSFLLMLDFFTRPPKVASRDTRLLPHFPSLVQTVYADEPCDSVHGDEKPGEWGEGEDLMGFGMDRLENAAEAAEGIGEAHAREGLKATGAAIGALASNMNAAMDVKNAISALMLISAVTVTVQVAPSEMVHLPHEGEPKGGQEGDVVFVAQVTVDVKDAPAGSIPCGSLAGSSVGSGRKPLKGVRVEWDWDDEWVKYYQLTNETVSRMTGRMATFTDEFGQTEIWWDAKKTCQGRGKVVGPDLVMQATAMNIIGPALDAVLGGSNPLSLVLKVGPSIYQFVAPELRGYVNYSLRWHEKKPREGGY